MHAMTLHAQADLWQHGAVTFAALFMAGEMRSPDNEIPRTNVLLYAVMNRGLHLATDLPRLALSPRPGWAVHLNPAKALTLTWPHVQPLLLDAPLNLPTGWREAAAGDHRRRPAILARSTTPEPRTRRIGPRLARSSG